jgi:hypothetical protein
MSQDRNIAQPRPDASFSADDIRHRMTEGEAQKAAEKLHELKDQEEKQKAIIAEFHKPSERTPDQLMAMVEKLVREAADRGQSEVQVYRFPNALCSDGGRRINNSDAEWVATLEGRPKFAYDFWNDHLKPLGFHLKAQVLDYPNGKPGDIGFFLTWKA